MIGRQDLRAAGLVFLITTAATSITGFLFPSATFGPPHILGALSLVILAGTIPARYTFHLRGHWRAVYTIGAALVLYFNSFVAVVQAFQKIEALKALAPTQSEPPFAIAQCAVLSIFVALGFMATRRFHPTELA